MANKKHRRKSRNHARRKDAYPGWVWMIFGLTIGLSVAFAIYVNGLARVPAVTVKQDKPAAAFDNNQERETEAAAVEAAEPPARFDFYKMLPNFEVVIPEQEPDVTKDVEPQAVVKPGIYVLQAGSFTRFEDADRRRAELAMQGLESRIQRVSIDDKTYHRVRIGPMRDLEQLNLVRSRLRQANIDVLRIRIGD
jgi:cell division protein FtsN